MAASFNEQGTSLLATSGAASPADVMLRDVFESAIEDGRTVYRSGVLLTFSTTPNACSSWQDGVIRRSTSFSVVAAFGEQTTADAPGDPLGPGAYEIRRGEVVHSVCTEGDVGPEDLAANVRGTITIARRIGALVEGAYEVRPANALPAAPVPASRGTFLAAICDGSGRRPFRCCD